MANEAGYAAHILLLAPPIDLAAHSTRRRALTRGRSASRRPRSRTVMDAILRDAEAGGDLDADTRRPLTARVGPALIIQQVLLTGVPPTRRELGEIVDSLLPGPASRTGE